MKCKKSEVINNFLNADGDSKTPNGSLFNMTWKSKSILYSYGEHFPLSIKLIDSTILINSDNYSNTTATQRGDLSRALGFDSFKDLISNKHNNIKISDTKELKELVESYATTYNEFIEEKI